MTEANIDDLSGYLEVGFEKMIFKKYSLKALYFNFVLDPSFSQRSSIKLRTLHQSDFGEFQFRGLY